MGDTYIISGLTQKRAELSGLIADLEKRIGQARADLVHVDAVLRMFAPDVVPEEIAPRKPAAARSAYFADGELSRRCLDALRLANGTPISADDIAVAAMKDKGLDPEDRKTRSDFIRRVLWALNRLLQRGLAQKVGSGLGSRWKAAE